MPPHQGSTRAAAAAPLVIAALLLVLGGCTAAGVDSPAASSAPPTFSPSPIIPFASASEANASNASATPALAPASGSPSPSPAPSFRIPVSAYLRDATSRATFSVVLERDDPQYGFNSIGIPTVGLLWTTVPLRIELQADGSLKVSYDGSGELDRAATLDLDYGIAAQTSGERDPVEISVEGSIGVDHRTGTVTVTVAGQRHVIVDRAPTESAQATLDAFVTATRKQDWRTSYELASSTMTRSFSEAEWVAKTEEGLVPYGRVVDAAAGPITYRSDAYLDLADAPFSITVEKDGARRVLEYTVTLVWEDGAWRVATTSAPPPP